MTGRPRGASTITQQLVRARLLPPEAFAGSTYERKIREIIQSIRLTQAYPGRGRQAADHDRLPEPELLRQPELRRRGGRQELLRESTSTKLTLAQAAILAAIPQSPSAYDLVQNAGEICLDRTVADGQACTTVSSSSRRTPRSSSAATTSSS